MAVTRSSDTRRAPSFAPAATLSRTRAPGCRRPSRRPRAWYLDARLQGRRCSKTHSLGVVDTFPPQFQIHVQFVGIEPFAEPIPDIAVRSGAETQSHCHDHVPGSWAVDVGRGVEADTGGDAVEPVGALGAAGVVAAGSVAPPPVTAEATFTCVTGPLSPGLPMRTLTLTFVAADWSAPADAAAGRAAAAASAVREGAVSTVVSPVSGVVSPVLLGSALFSAT